MGFSLRDHWLMALAYPCGPRADLPAGPMRDATLIEMLDRADRHGVLPATLTNLKSVIAREGSERVVLATDEPVVQTVERAFKTAEQRLLLRSAQALQLRWLTREACAALKSAGVPHLVLKGCEFADRLYAPPALRTFTDVDLLVPFSSLGAVGGVMHGLGYRPRDPEGAHAPDYAESAWQRPGRQGMVEIHWNVVHSPSLRKGISLAYEDLQRDDQGRASTASLLLIAAVHAAASHGFDRMGPLCDVALSARGTAVAGDLEWLSGTARNRGIGLALLAALKLAGELYPEPACAGLIERLGLPVRRLWRYCLSPGMVLRLHAKRDSFRRQGFRQMLKSR
jgi:hypothetical protein